MKTLETINGQKVWAVDRLGCIGCMFREDMICPDLLDIVSCNSFERLDKRDVIFLPYSEEELKEKTFTLSQINEVIDEMYNNQTTNPYFEAGRRNALVVLKQKLEQL